MDKAKEKRSMNIDQQKMWKINIIKEERLRMKWYQNNEDRLIAASNKEKFKFVPESMKEELKQETLDAFQDVKKPKLIKTVKDFPDNIDEISVLNVMKPIDREIKALIYSGTEKDGRVKYLKERNKLSPEQKFYFPETSNFIYGWKMYEGGIESVANPYARQQVIKSSFYRRRGVERDPEWHKSCTKPSPTICGII